MKTLIKNYLDNYNIKTRTINEDESQTLYKFRVALEKGNCDTFIDIRTDPKQVLISTYFPIKIPVEHHIGVSEFILRVNHMLSIGSFDIDFERSEVCYKNEFLYNNISQDMESIFHFNLLISFRRMDRYIPGIMSIIYANAIPIQALNKIENVINPELN